MVINKIHFLIEEASKTIDRWSANIPSKNHFKVPTGLFKSSAEEIAKVISENKTAQYKTAMSRLNFYLNRGGKNIPEPTRNEINKAKDILKKMYGRTDIK